MGHSLLCMMGFFLLSTVICGNAEDHSYDSQDADKEEEQTTSVPIKPTVTVQPFWPQIYSGETVTVRCVIQGGEGAQWTYEWRAAKSNTPPTSNEYKITVTESDSGGYSCRGRRSSSWTEWSDTITLTVIAPPEPTVTLQPSRTQIYSGETVTVRCEIQGGEGAQWTYEWRPARLNTPPTSSEYRITVTEFDSGGYSCRGRTDRFFTEWSDIITLTVSSPPKPTVTLQPSWTQIYRGETVTMRCEIQGGEGAQWTYEWRRGHSNIREKSNEYKITATESDSGGYTCIGRRGNFYTQWSDSITLTVSSPPKPTVTLQPSWTQIYSGETVTVRCEIQGGKELSGRMNGDQPS
ncbi:agglutinin-like protein 4 [Oreochromis niloticus]|uniref:agglutinin-like protein 4 n=1 Tax=Oreochromis niloticus TaxID=8128 RepID=UPI000DF4841B|nr:agglutinin-like protein 4 [Oreochromis niloticus]